MIFVKGAAGSRISLISDPPSDIRQPTRDNIKITGFACGLHENTAWFYARNLTPWVGFNIHGSLESNPRIPRKVFSSSFVNYNYFKVHKAPYLAAVI